MTTRKLLIFIPTYNERDNAGRMCRELLDLEADILFVDDNSPDGTADLLESLAREEKRLTVLRRPGKLGIGSAHQDGIAYAYDHGYERLVTMDCDFTHSPSDIPRLLAASDGADVVVGSRYMNKKSLPGWSPFRRVLTMFGHFLTKTLLRLPQDASGAFRLYDLGRIKRDVFRLVTAKSYSFFFESLFILVNNGLRVKEIPIVLPARTYGHSKLTFAEASRSARYLAALSMENWAAPERFRLRGRDPDDAADLIDPQNWDAYWGRKQSAGGLVYDVIAAGYRKLFIKRNLQAALNRIFPEGARLLHAGCGSGQVDADLHERFRITAVDISPAALDLYCRNNPKAASIRRADLFALPFGDSEFDGVYNLGVMEHFTEEEILRILGEVRRVLKRGGKAVFFWPHARSSSVFVLRAVHWLMRKIIRKQEKFHPDEVTLLNNRTQARKLLLEAGLTLESYRFGPTDLCIQAVIIGRKEA